MEDQFVYECEQCGKTSDVGADENKIPECCGQPMRKIPKIDACEMSTTAEHSRFDDLGEPCDDGRSGKV